MHNQYSPYLLKASLPTAVAAALLSFAQMANSTVTDYSPDFSNAVEISFNEDAGTNPTQADRGWFGTTTSSNHCELEFKLTNSQMRDVDVIGAWRTSSGTYDSQVRENKLLIAGSNVNVKRVMGSYLGEDTVDNAISVFDNVLEISEGQTQEAWGVYVEEINAEATNNHAVMSGGKAEYFVGVAHVNNGFQMSGNSSTQATLGADDVSSKIITSDIRNNRTIMTSGEVTQLYGVLKRTESHMVLSGETSHNTLEIYGGTVGLAYGVITTAKGKYDNNAVIIHGDNSDTKMISSLHGILFNPNLNAAQDVNTTFTGNTVTIDDAHVGVVYLNQTQSNGKFTYTNNTLNLTNAQSETAYGIFTSFTDDGVDTQIDKIENTVITLENSTLTGDVYLIRDHSKSSTSEITGNFVNLIGTSTVAGTLSFVDSNSANVHNNGLRAQGVHSVGQFAGQYDTLKLTVGTENNAATGAPILTLAQGDLDLSDIDVTISNLDGLNADESYKLIHTAGGTIHVDAGTIFKTEGTLFTDTTWEFTKDFDKDTLSTGDFVKDEGGNGDDGGSDIIPDVTPNDNSRTLSDSILGSVAVINQGASFIANEGLNAMDSASLVDQSAVFGTLGGGKTRYDTGSRVDVDCMSLVTGLVTRVTPEWMVAGYVEAGFGNSESSTHDASAEGNHDYYGVGLASRYHFNLPVYVDGSLRFGTASTEFSGKYTEESAKYDANSLYGSAHIGLGYVFDLADKVSLDVYGRYIFTYLEGDTVSLGTTDHERLKSEDTKTHTMQVGAMLRGTTPENISWRFGLAYEHVADGDAESTVFTKTDLVALDIPTLEGDSGIVDLGITMRSKPTDPMALDLGLKGYVGDYQGVTGTVTWSYAF